jgi:hypothetical protein
MTLCSGTSDPSIRPIRCAPRLSSWRLKPDSNKAITNQTTPKTDAVSERYVKQKLVLLPQIFTSWMPYGS